MAVTALVAVGAFAVVSSTTSTSDAQARPLGVAPIVVPAPTATPSSVPVAPTAAPTPVDVAAPEPKDVAPRSSVPRSSASPATTEAAQPATTPSPATAPSADASWDGLSDAEFDAEVAQLRQWALAQGWDEAAVEQWVDRVRSWRGADHDEQPSVGGSETSGQKSSRSWSGSKREQSAVSPHGDD